MAWSRLLDEFRTEWSQGSSAPSAELRECCVFVDLMWTPLGHEDAEASDPRARAEAFDARAKADPAFTVEGYSRYLALARICQEIRYYAGPHLVYADVWSRADPQRREVIRLEEDKHEIGILPTVMDAVRFTEQYLVGRALREIDVARKPPPWFRAD